MLRPRSASGLTPENRVASEPFLKRSQAAAQMPLGDEVARHHGSTPQFPGAHRHDEPLPGRVLLEDRGVAAAVHGDDAAGDGVLVRRPLLGARAGAGLAGTDAHVRLVPVAPDGVPTRHGSCP